jgi:hypothetical protein
VYSFFDIDSVYDFLLSIDMRPIGTARRPWFVATAAPDSGSVVLQWS